MGKVAMLSSTQRFPRPIPTVGAGLLCVLFLLTLGLCGAGYARTKETAAPSFTIDVEKPFDQVVRVVEDVARGPVIRGTFEYAGDQQLEGAQFAETSRLFPTWSKGGKVFFKLRGKTLAPKHFIDSNDVGTVAVRYVVQDAGASITRLIIDAVFVENGGHHGHASDGYVETCEFAEIGKRLKELDQQQTLRASGQEFSPSRESSSQADASSVEVNASGKTGDIEHAIAEQKMQLAGESANLQKLEDQSRQIRASEFMRIKAERAELKASPYSHAHVLEALKQGQEVTVLAKSTYWYRVRAEDGQEGWVSHSSLETHP
jgi:hypothetical protein